MIYGRCTAPLLAYVVARRQACVDVRLNYVCSAYTLPDVRYGNVHSAYPAFNWRQSNRGLESSGMHGRDRELPQAAGVGCHRV